MQNTDLSFGIKEKIRQTTLQGLQIGGDSARSFMSENENHSVPLIAVELPFYFDSASGYPEILKKLWKADSLEQALLKAQESSADLISIKFNLKEETFVNELDKVKDFLTNVLNKIKKPLILRGANSNAADMQLLPLLAEYAPKECIIAFADENTYEAIVPSVVKNNHILVLRTPIDINIAKELNILSTDKGLSPERILIDPDMGGLGYGLDYGYSIIEKIRQAAFDGDTMLNMPIIAFIGEESYRAKEAKSDTFCENWGNYQERAAMWEISGASAMISAGADIVVLWNPKSVDVMKGLLKG